MGKIAGIIAVVAVVGAASFYGGQKYAESKTEQAVRGGNVFANLTPEDRQARIGQFGGSGGGRTIMRGGAGFAAGEIISKDEKSITVKLRDGGSKIIFINEATPVSKNVEGSIQDLTTGEDVVVTGSANQDGSISAQSIQMRPVMLGVPGQQNQEQ